MTGRPQRRVAGRDGKAAAEPPRQSAGGHCRVKEAAAQVGKAPAREQAAEQWAAEREANRKGPGPEPGGTPDSNGQALADAGYCSEANLTCPGPDRLIAVGKRRDLEQAARGQDGTGGSWGGPAVQAMRERLKTEAGITAYRQRGHIAETPHGHIKHNMGLRCS